MPQGKPKDDDRKRPRAEPVSLSPLSFEDAVRALAATPPMTDKPKRQPTKRDRKKPSKN
jgi:hypothetical protein